MRRTIARSPPPIADMRDSVQRLHRRAARQPGRAGESDLRTVACRLPLLAMIAECSASRRPTWARPRVVGPDRPGRGSSRRAHPQAYEAINAAPTSRTPGRCGPPAADSRPGPGPPRGPGRRERVRRLTAGELARPSSALLTGHGAGDQHCRGEDARPAAARAVGCALRRPGRPRGGSGRGLLRFVSPVQTINRVAVADIELAGTTVRDVP